MCFFTFPPQILSIFRVEAGGFVSECSFRWMNGIVKYPESRKSSVSDRDVVTNNSVVLFTSSNHSIKHLLNVQQNNTNIWP